MNLYNHTTCDQPPLLFFFNSPHLRPFLLSLFDSSSPISGRHHEKRGRKQEGSGRNQLPVPSAQDRALNFLFCRGFGPTFFKGGIAIVFYRIRLFLFLLFLLLSPKFFIWISWQIFFVGFSPTVFAVCLCILGGHCGFACRCLLAVEPP